MAEKAIVAINMMTKTTHSVRLPGGKVSRWMK